MSVCYTLSMQKINRLFSGKTDSHCASPDAVVMNRAMNLIGDRWTLMIVGTLLGGSKRFGELLEVMDNVSPKTVSQRLKMLEEIGLVERHAFAEIPPRVEYKLTEKGLALADIVESIRKFGEIYLNDDSLDTRLGTCP